MTKVGDLVVGVAENHHRSDGPNTREPAPRRQWLPGTDPPGQAVRRRSKTEFVGAREGSTDRNICRTTISLRPGLCSPSPQPRHQPLPPGRHRRQGLPIEVSPVHDVGKSGSAFGRRRVKLGIVPRPSHCLVSAACFGDRVHDFRLSRQKRVIIILVDRRPAARGIEYAHIPINATLRYFIGRENRLAYGPRVRRANGRIKWLSSP